MSDVTCAFADGCDAPVEIKARKLCKKHYQYLYRRGRLADEVPLGPTPGLRKCSIGGCENKHKAHGFCRKHLYAEVLAGNVRTATCSFSPCGRPAVSSGYCQPHYRQIKAGKPLAPLQVKTRRGAKCGGPNCSQPVLSRGLCGAHYLQMSKGHELTEVIRDAPNLKGQPCVACAQHCDERNSYTMDGLCRTHARWRASGDEDWERKISPKAPDGAGHLNVLGYRFVTHEGRKRPEHCVIAERLLGRPLAEGENIHHLNGNRSDNRINGPFVMDEFGRMRSGNIEVWSTHQPAGQQVGQKLKWAAELFDQYGQFDLEVARRMVARGVAILGQLGEAQERRACAAFSRALAVDVAPATAGAEPALF